MRFVKKLVKSSSRKRFLSNEEIMRLPEARREHRRLLAIVLIRPTTGLNSVTTRFYFIRQNKQKRLAGKPASLLYIRCKLVGARGFEPPTLRSRTGKGRR